MHENDNEVPNREVQDTAAVENTTEATATEAAAAGDGQPVSEEQADIQIEAPAVQEHVEERQAEEFAEEMAAEPHNIDGEAGEATPAEEAAANSASHADEASAEAAEPPAKPHVEEQQAEEFAEEMEAEPHNIDGEAGEATPAEEAAADSATHADEASAEAPAKPQEAMSADEILAPDAGREQPKWPAEDAELTAMLEAVIYITDEPLTLEQISTALEQPRDRIKRLLNNLVSEWQKPQHGLSIREVAGGYKMATKPEHHDAVRQFVKSLKAPMKLSLPSLETLAVIAYKQPVTSPEIMEIRGVQGAGVLKTLIDRKLIAPAGRKNVIGKPILYKTTREFLVQFGLKDLSELPSVKEFEELARFATEPEPSPAEPNPPAPTAPAAQTMAEQEPAPEPTPEQPAEAEAPQNAATIGETAEVESEPPQDKSEPETEPATEPVTE